MPIALDYLHASAEVIGEYGRFLTTAVGTTSTLITSMLANSTLTATEFATMTVLVETGADAGQVGHIQGGGLDRSTGKLTIGDPLTDAVASGIWFSLYRLLAPLREGVEPSLLDVVNLALRDYVWIEHTLDMAGVTGQRYYPIDTDTYPALTDQRRFIDVLRPVTSAQDMPLALARSDWDWDTVGETKRLVLLSTPFNTGETFKIKVYLPGNARLVLNATARATVVAGAVTAVTAVLPGYYTAVPTVSITGGGGTGATATATLSGGGVASISVGAGGSGYTTTPVVSFTRNASDLGWANQTSQMAGLLGIADRAIPDVTDVKTVVAWLAFRQLAAMQAPGATVAEWLAKAEQWGKEANTLEHVGEPSNLRTNVAAIRPVLVSPRGSRWGGGPY